MGNAPTAVNMSLDPNDPCVVTLKMLWYTRFHPKLNPWWTRILVPLNFCTYCLFFGLAVKGILLSFDNNILYTTQCLQTCAVVLDVLDNGNSELKYTYYKVVMYHTRKQQLISLLEQKLMFWKPINCDKDIAEKFHKTITNATTIIRYFYMFTLTTTFVINLSTITSHELPLVTYVPHGYLFYLLPIFWLTNYLTVPANIASEGFFLGFSLSLVAQVNLLSHRIKALRRRNHDNQKAYRQLKNLILYHKFLLNYRNNLYDMFNIVIFIKYFGTIFAASVATFIFMTSTDGPGRVACLLFVASYITQMAFYCIPAEYVVNAFNRISDSIYASDWYKKNEYFKKSLKIVMITSQQSPDFQACGMVLINLKSFITVCKTTFTFYTYINKVKKSAK